MILALAHILLHDKRGYVAWIGCDSVRISNPELIRHGQTHLVQVLPRQPGEEGLPWCEILPLEEGGWVAKALEAAKGAEVNFPP